MTARWMTKLSTGWVSETRREFAVSAVMVYPHGCEQVVCCIELPLQALQVAGCRLQSGPKYERVTNRLPSRQVSLELAAIEVTKIQPARAAFRRMNGGGQKEGRRRECLVEQRSE
jgi:hypothetical protein